MTSLEGCVAWRNGEAREELGTCSRHHGLGNAFWGTALLFGGPQALVEGVGYMTKASREIRLCLGRDLTDQAR